MPLREVPILHLRHCRHCGRPSAICCGCDRGHRYGSRACSEAARREQRRQAKRRHLQTPHGRDNNARHQREYRARRRQRRLSLCVRVPSSRLGCGPERLGRGLPQAVLPGSGRDPLLRLTKDPDADGFYEVRLEDGQTAGRFQLFDESLLDGMNTGFHLLASPASFAYLIEAAGAICLERTGAILDERVPPDAGTAEPEDDGEAS